ncbi:DNA-directed RNA polymerase subunit RPC12/RpoP [Paenibacillus anaericanus]|uniref:hypothetical protein n=1 Tax=Paenibacillus TaxID=44249 RepID=UPI00278694A9|nr:hypothetical protein [Paenibacillus anaericanus]MDQ0087178.1 DNA-directed RNA polymerase subunit RPC12/RpoP [Paenibacillus anaericanus]
METTICPWCQTEIVWDEELGPEEECPYCHNELKGYRTLNIDLDSDIEDEEEGNKGGQPFWEEENEEQLESSRRLDVFAAGGRNPLVYESGVETLLNGQDEVPECPHCREYMLFTGKQSLAHGDFEGVVPEGLKNPLVLDNAKLNVYVCSACFHVSRFLSEDDRNALIQTISGENDK